ncbi:CrtK protein [Novosphingobium fuchskuhlense]|uniref:CrtK protein n=1 Tax=Novosphingobium fuchskuhlense TaxID=1117702 RepID=A0A117UYA5_9SPHN|nr:TspO/MBR family protein [Novosphingobium fuchskuhlense]KUR73060.1 CrtK protein [Novosphingobium fuchskuhlense]
MRYLASPAQLRASLLRWSLFTVPAVLGLGFVSSIVANAGPQNPWFAALAKPALYPPPATFGIVWSLLYVLIGVALAMVASARGAQGRGVAAAVFALQLALNLAWSPVFFGLHQMTIALGIIAAMILLMLALIPLFWRVRPLAGALLLPYMAWICFASVLNYQFLALNPMADGAQGSEVRVQI